MAHSLCSLNWLRFFCFWCSPFASKQALFTVCFQCCLFSLILFLKQYCLLPPGAHSDALKHIRYFILFVCLCLLMFRLVEIKLRAGVCFMRQPRVLAHIWTSQASRTALENVQVKRERQMKSSLVWDLEKGQRPLDMFRPSLLITTRTLISRYEASSSIPQNCFKERLAALTKACGFILEPMFNTQDVTVHSLLAQSLKVSGRRETEALTWVCSYPCTCAYMASHISKTKSELFEAPNTCLVSQIFLLNFWPGLFASTGTAVSGGWVGWVLSHPTITACNSWQTPWGYSISHRSSLK